MASFKVNAPTITVEALAGQFWARYLGGGGYASPEAAAEALLGILSKVYSQGGREDVRTFLRGIKEQVAPPAVRAAATGPVFALAAALAAAAERLRQFSPVKGHDKLGSCVLEELRLRLYRVITGETFANDTAVRRHALDCCFALMMKEEEAKQRCQQRAAAQRAASGQAPAAAASVSGSFTASSFSARSAGSFLGAQNGPKEKLSLGRIMSERMSGLSGPDTSSWSALWSSLMESALGHQAMPLLQSVLMDLYNSGNLAAAVSLSRGSASLSACGSKGRGGGAAQHALDAAGSGAYSRTSSNTSERSSLVSQPLGAAVATPGPAASDDVGAHGSDRGSPHAGSGSAGGASAPAGPGKSGLGGAAAAFAGRFAAAATGARARMARLSEKGVGRDADARDAAASAPGPAGSAGDAAPPAVPSSAAEGGMAAAAAAQQPGTAPGAAVDEPEGQQKQRVPSVAGVESGAIVPQDWVVFGGEAPGASPGSTCHVALAGSSGGAADAAAAATPPPAAAAVAATEGGSSAPGSPAHHRRNSSRTLRFWAEDSANWAAPEEPSVTEAAAATAVAH